MNPASTYAGSIFHQSSFYLSKNYFFINPSSIYARFIFINPTSTEARVIVINPASI